MSERERNILFEDILESTDKISRYIENLSLDDFVVQQIVIDAVVRNVEIIGEAANRVPEDIQKKFSKTP
jgi:uncharacterized protein with HEPN domain